MMPATRILPIAALAVGLLETAAAFHVLLIAPASGVGAAHRTARSLTAIDPLPCGAGTFSPSPVCKGPRP